jgi:hypothetical protein
MLERVALGRPLRLAGDHRPNEQAERVEPRLGAIAVGVGHAVTREHAIVELGARHVAGGVPRHDGVGNFGNDVQAWKRYVAVVAVLAPTVGGMFGGALAHQVDNAARGLFRTLFAEGAGCGYSMDRFRFDA